MESDNARYYKTHPSEWWCQNCGGNQRDRDLAVLRGHLVNRKVSFRNNKDPVCFCCKKTDNQEQMLSCDTPSCTIHAHVSCYFVTGSEQERDCLGDMADWVCHQCSGCQIPALAATGGLADRTPTGPRGDTYLVPIQATPPAPSLGGWGGTSSRAKDLPLPTDIRKQVLHPAIGAPTLNEGQPSASKRHAGSRPVGGGSWGNQDAGDISSAVSGRQTDLIGAVHLFPSPGANATPHPVG